MGENNDSLESVKKIELTNIQILRIQKHNMKLKGLPSTNKKGLNLPTICFKTKISTIRSSDEEKRSESPALA